MKKFLLALNFIFLAACAPLDAQIALKTNAISANSTPGRGAKIRVIIMDERPNPASLGIKEFGDHEILITSEKTLKEFLQDRITSGLLEQGFTIGENKNLILYVKTLKYKSKRGFPVGKSKFEAKIRLAITDRSGNELFGKKYQMSFNNKHLIVSSLTKDQELVNLALHEILNDILGDKEVIEKLN